MKTKDLHPLVRAAMLCALTFLGSLLSIPTPMGNVNFGDGILISGVFLLDTPWTFPAVALGAALSDLNGYALYAPATFLIKAAMAGTVYFCNRQWKKRGSSPRFRVIFCGTSAEILMMGGYYLYEAALYRSFAVPLAPLPFNLLQGIFAVIFSVVFIGTVQKKGM